MAGFLEENKEDLKNWRLNAKLEKNEFKSLYEFRLK